MTISMYHICEEQKNFRLTDDVDEAEGKGFKLREEGVSRFAICVMRYLPLLERTLVASFSIDPFEGDPTGLQG